jgi:hypothetical protein
MDALGRRPAFSEPCSPEPDCALGHAGRNRKKHIGTPSRSGLWGAHVNDMPRAPAKNPFTDGARSSGLDHDPMLARWIPFGQSSKLVPSNGRGTEKFRRTAPSLLLPDRCQMI